MHRFASIIAAALPWLFSAGAALAAPTTAAESGHVAWVLTASALVLFMTLPGLALFYGGLVQAKNLLSVIMQCFSICCVVSLIWAICRLFAGVRRHRRGAGQLFEKLSRRPRSHRGAEQPARNRH